jgi:sulfite exporter TauE/SafE
MLSSITPLGERGRASSWAVTATAYVVGSVVAGALLGALLGLTGAGLYAGSAAVLPGSPSVGGGTVLALLAVLGLAGAALDLRLGGLALPTISRQVDEDWLARYRNWVYGGGFGLQLGLGVVTIVTTSTVYLTLAAALLSGSVWAGLAIGSVFGLVRALPLLAVRGVSSPDALGVAFARLEAARRPVATAAVATLGALSVGAATLALSAGGTA